MPLTMLEPGRDAVIARCGLREKTRSFLEGLGLLPGTVVSVVAETGGNLILNVKGSRLAISRGVAQQMHVELV